MSTYPLAQTIRHSAFDGTTRDSRGNVIDSWADPVDVRCFWHTSNSHEPQIAGHDRVLVDASVYVPMDMEIGTKDRFELPGLGEFEVVGIPDDFNHGPWWVPGLLVVNLRRITG